MHLVIDQKETFFFIKLVVEVAQHHEERVSAIDYLQSNKEKKNKF